MKIHTLGISIVSMLTIACGANGPTNSSFGAAVEQTSGSPNEDESEPPNDDGPRLDMKAYDTASGRDPDDTRAVPVREEECVGDVCTCLHVALLGTLDTAANDKNTQPFVDWLNDNSGGTATVEMITVQPTLDEAWLSNYDILLVANVNGWVFSPADKAAVETWVRETGGGIIALTGFVSTPQEPSATSQLIEFAGMGFVGPQRTAENGQQIPVYFGDNRQTDLKNCLAWSGSSDAIITTPIPITPGTGSLEKLTYALSYVGAFIGWGVQAPPEATVIATDPVTGANMAVALEVDATGRIFAFGDEWVILRNQWEPVGNPNNMQQDQYNPCWNEATQEDPAFFHSVATLYQTKQFWFDAINWVAPPNECGFVILDPGVAIP